MDNNSTETQIKPNTKSTSPFSDAMPEEFKNRFPVATPTVHREQINTLSEMDFPNIPDSTPTSAIPEPTKEKGGDFS